eukprot:TRINITY_DN1275_c0_g1_i2.p1 TRINITY_DN1275_c0_g1~~TRINITY_DN1275_c0_g1_i2.p1  ORF type:complete len:292 (+),score=59.45 TRINITY_DN1275_c0_g1_i2:285-1160(+)
MKFEMKWANHTHSQRSGEHLSREYRREERKLANHIMQLIETNNIESIRSVCFDNYNIASVLNNYFDVDGFTPLYYACQLGSLEIVRLLLDYGANIEQAVFPDLSTPLMVAVNDGHLEVFKELLKRGANINKTNTNDATPLDLAIKFKHTVIINELLNHPKLDINVKAKWGTFLITALRCEDVKTAMKLIEKGINVELTDASGCTALHWAAYNNQLEVVRALLKAGASPNCQDVNKDTPLHLATKHNFISICMELIKNGANVNAENTTRITPLHLTRRFLFRKFMNENFDTM